MYLLYCSTSVHQLCDVLEQHPCVGRCTAAVQQSTSSTAENSVQQTAEKSVEIITMYSREISRNRDERVEKHGDTHPHSYTSCSPPPRETRRHTLGENAVSYITWYTAGARCKPGRSAAFRPSQAGHRPALALPLRGPAPWSVLQPDLQQV